MCKGWLDLTLDAPRALERASREQPRVSCCRWMQGEPSPIPKSMVSVKVPGKAQVSLRD